MEIRIYNPMLDWLGAVTNLIRYEIIDSLYGVGKFEMDISINGKLDMNLLKVSNILLINGKLLIIEGFSLDITRETRVLKVFGTTIKGLLSRRLITPLEDSSALGYDTFEGSAESCIKYFVGRNIVNSKDLARNIPNLEISEDKGRGNKVLWRGRYSNLAEELEEICKYAGLGYAITPDLENKKWVFDIIEGKDRSAFQEENDPITFRTDYTNIDNFVYEEDYISYANTFYLGGEGENENRLIYTLNADNSGFNRSEVFIKCYNAENIDELKMYGRQKAVEYEPKKEL